MAPYNDPVTLSRQTLVITRDRVPPEVISLLLRGNLLSEYFIRYLPPWVMELIIDITDDDCVAQVTVNTQYRQVYLDIGHNFYVKTEDERRLTLTHEAVHAYTAILEDFAETLMSSLGLEDDPVYEAQYNRARETVAQDLTGLILSLNPGGLLWRNAGQRCRTKKR